MAGAAAAAAAAGTAAGGGGAGGEADFTWTIDATTGDGAGNPVPDAHISVDGPAGHTTRADASGRASIEITGPGRYRLQAFHGGNESNILTFEETAPSEGTSYGAELVIDRAAEHSVEITVVREADGTPIQHALVKLEPAPDGMNPESLSNSDGMTYYHPLVDGHYMATASFEGERGTASFEIQGDDVEGVTIRLSGEPKTGRRSWRPVPR